MLQLFLNDWLVAVSTVAHLGNSSVDPIELSAERLLFADQNIDAARDSTSVAVTWKLSQLARVSSNDDVWMLPNSSSNRLVFFFGFLNDIQILNSVHTILQSFWVFRMISNRVNLTVSVRLFLWLSLFLWSGYSSRFNFRFFSSDFRWFLKYFFHIPAFSYRNSAILRCWHNFPNHSELPWHFDCT